MIGNSSDESVEDEGIVIEEMIIGMNPWQKGWKQTEEHEDVPSGIWATGKPDATDEDENICCQIILFG